MRIRPARPEDAAVLRGLLPEGWSGPPPGGPLGDGDLERWPVYVAEVGGVPVGGYRMRPLGETAWVDLGVAARWRGRGIGSRLWRHALATAHYLGAAALAAEVAPADAPFFLRLGAQPVRAAPGSEPEGRLWLRLSLRAQGPGSGP